MPLAHDPSLVTRLRARGVLIHAPESVVLCDLDPARVEAGVELFPGVTVCGRRTLLRAGTRLGLTGGGYFEDVRCGRGVTLYGGFVQDAVLLDGVTLRGHAEVRGGTLLEEGGEGAHHVGYKMTVALPFVVAGSLINFCDALIAGGTSRRDHTEIGSCLALYNFTPWGDKFASLFGDVPRGVFLRSPRIFIGGQTQVISPVSVGYGAVLAAGCAVRRSVPDGRLYGEGAPTIDAPMSAVRYGRVEEKAALSARYIANLRCLRRWYEAVRLPLAADDPLQVALYQDACAQLDAGIDERLKRLERFVSQLPASRAAHAEALASAPDAPARARAQARIDDHDHLLGRWPRLRDHLARPLPPAADPRPLEAVREALAAYLRAHPEATYIDALTLGLDDALVAAGVAHLERLVEATLDPDA